MNKDKYIQNLQKSIKDLKIKIAGLVREAHPKVEDFLINGTFTVAVKEIDSDLLQCKLYGSGICLNFKLLKVTESSDKESILSVIETENLLDD